MYTGEDAAHQTFAARKACRDRLPGYMVPTHIIPVTRIPLTVNNKVDTKALIALLQSLNAQDLQRLQGEDEDEAALTETEQKIAKVLSTMLKIEQPSIARNSNFFSLGMSSISAMTFSTLLRRDGFPAASVASIMQST